MKIHKLDSNLWLPQPIERVFAFFADAHNLEELTPPWLNFTILRPYPISMAVGTRIRYKLRLRGIPVQWESEITAWEPPRRFADDQVRGPYQRWHHVHEFSDRDGGTDVADHVEYSVLGGALVNALLVAPDVRKIFAYRSAKLREIFKA